MIKSHIKYKNNKIHYIFIFILSLNYLIPYIIFGNVTLFYHDTLDSEIPYNLAIGKFLKGDFDSVKIFLNGQLNILYFRRVFQLYSFFYSWLNFELAYWTLDALVKITSYISFFILAKKININLFFCSLIACLYASANLPTHEGFGLAIFPYLVYLILYKDKLRLKHYFLIIFFGLNSDFIFTAFAIPIISLAILFINKKKILNLFIVVTLFSFALIISNINLIILNFQNIHFHREEWIRQTLSFRESFIFFANNLISLPLSSGWIFFKTLPLTIYKLPLVFLSLFSKDINIKKIFAVIILTSFILTLISHEVIGSLINKQSGLIKILSWNYVLTSYNFLFCLISIFILRRVNLLNNILIIFFFISVFLFQINSSVVPFVKKIILKEENYQNLYTFKGYYFFHNYPKIIQIIGNSRVMSVGLDPMVATIYGINIIDGYHSLYPLSYKKQFREIIEKELSLNTNYKKYFDDYGSRLYTTLYQPKNIENFSLNYDKAKEIGAKFVISSLNLNSEELELIYGNCDTENFCLYKIK